MIIIIMIYIQDASYNFFIFFLFSDTIESSKPFLFFTDWVVRCVVKTFQSREGAFIHKSDSSRTQADKWTYYPATHTHTCLDGGRLEQVLLYLIEMRSPWWKDLKEGVILFRDNNSENGNRKWFFFF